MKLFMFVSYDDSVLKVCKDQKEAEKIFKQVMDEEVDGGYNRIFEIKEIDGYEIQVRKKITEQDMFDSMG